MMDYTNPNDFWSHHFIDPFKDLDNNERLAAGCINGFIVIGTFLAGCLLCLLFGSCTTTEYITVPEIHEVHHHHTDSIKQTDSVTVEKETVIMQLDSVAMAQYGIQIKSAERAWLVKTAELERRLQQLIENHTDTVHERDSIPYPVEVVKEVPSQLNWWQQTRIHIANILLYLLAFYILFWIARKRLFKI